MRAVIQRVLAAEVDRGRDGRRRARRPRAARLPRRHPHRRPRRRRLDGAQDLGAAAPARRAVRLRGRRPAAGGQPVHAVRRRPQGPAADLAGRRARARSASRCTTRSAPSSSGSAPGSRAGSSAPTCRSRRSTTARSRWSSRAPPPAPGWLRRERVRWSRCEERQRRASRPGETTADLTGFRGSLALAPKPARLGRAAAGPRGWWSRERRRRLGASLTGFRGSLALAPQRAGVTSPGFEARWRSHLNQRVGARTSTSGGGVRWRGR